MNNKNLLNVLEIIYAFKAQWFDPHSQLMRFFQIRYFIETNQIEIIDLKTNKIFLKKTIYPNTSSSNDSDRFKDFFISSKILLYGRHYEIIDYYDTFTKDKLEIKTQKVYCFITYSTIGIPSTFGKILNTFLIDNNMILSYIKLINNYNKNKKNNIMIEFIGENSIEKAKLIVSSLRTKYFTNSNDYLDIQISNNITETSPFYQKHKVNNDNNNNDFLTIIGNTTPTCCVIQPHIIKEGKVGQLIDTILNKSNHLFHIIAMEMFTLDRTKANEFLEVYDGVLPYFNEKIDEIITGPCIALACIPSNVNDKNNNFNKSSIEIFRNEIAGPWDIDMAKELKPETIRGKYGMNRIKNAIHCTDLPEDGLLECQYFFEILTNLK